MFHNNKELRISLVLLSLATALLTLIGLSLSVTTGVLILISGLIAIAIHLSTEYYRYRKLQKLSSDLDQLLIDGIPLPIRDYQEGELSILANHIQKLTLRLIESAEVVENDKKHLADSLADISHQLRTPLTSMNLTTSMLRDPELSTEKRMELTGELRRLLTRTDWLVETLLKISKLDAGTVKLAQKKISVRQLIDQAAAPLAIPMDLRDQTLTVHCMEEYVKCDLVWTAEAMGNILKNCMEHTPESGTIELGQRMLDGYPMSQDSPCYIYEQGNEVFNGEVLDVKETRTYKVVGFYERLSWRIETFEAPGYTALTLSDKETYTPYKYDVYFRMENPKDTFDFMKEMKLTGDYNSDLLMYSGTFAVNAFTTMLYSLAAIVIGLIMFGSVALIYNAFSISVSERTKQFGLLSSIGATKKQLKRMVFFEALSVSVIGIPIGVIAGVGGIGVTLMLLGDKFKSMGFGVDMKLSVSPAAIIIAVIVALITVLISAWIPSKRATKVSAVEAIRQNLDVKNTKPVKTSKLTYKLFGLPGMLANKHYKRNKKKYRTTVLSLFMSIVLFVSASAFTDYLMETVGVGFGSVGYDLSMHASGNAFDKITPEELLNRMKAAKSVTGGAYSQERNVYSEISTEYLTDEGVEFLDRNQGQGKDKSVRNAYIYITFVDDATFRALLEDNGLNEKKYMDPKNPLAIAVDGATMFNLYTQKYETTTFFNKDEFSLVIQKEKDIPGYYCSGEITNETGKTVVRYSKDPESDVEGDKDIFFSLEEGYIYTPINVGNVIYEKPFFVRDSNGMRFIYPFSLAEQVFEDFDAINNSYYYMLTSDSHAESYTAVETILKDNGFNTKNIQNIAEMEESERNIVTIIRVFSYGFIVLISLIAAANVFNTISTNISLRRREFAMLKSVGMAQKDFNKMMNFECLLYGSRALLYGLPVSCGVTYLIYLAIMEGYEARFHLPWTAIGIAVLSVFLVVFITMMYSMSKIKKDNPIDALKNENL